MAIELQAKASIQARPRVNPWRVVLGFVVAPLLPSITWALADGADKNLGEAFTFGWLVAAVGAYLPTIVLGLPAFFLLRLWLRPTLVTLAAVGGLVAALPWAVFMLAGDNPSQAWSGTCRTVLDGQLTLCGLVARAKLLSLIFALGALGGITFWVCVVWREPRLKRDVGLSQPRKLLAK